MKYHKIRNVDLTVCTAEQKIAYNLAWQYRDYVLSGKFSSYAEAAQELSNIYKRTEKKPGQYDIDSIFCALNAGLEEYCKRPFIACSYSEVGKAFPAHYLNNSPGKGAAG